MSSPLAIAGVTAVLKDLLNEGLINHDLSKVGSFAVTALPPDRITTGTTEPNQINLFMYLVTPNQGWRNAALPSHNGNGGRVTNHPLALDLHYMLTAYGSEDFNAEILLGYAMHVLHETPVPSRQMVRRALGGGAPVSGGILPPSPSPFGTLMADDLADQAEMIKVTPHALTTDEMSKLWTTFQAKYRPSSAYMVSVVLIEATNPAISPLPVLRRGRQDRGVKVFTAALPTMESMQFERGKPGAELGRSIIIRGQSFVGDDIQMVFRHHKLGDLLPALKVRVITENEITVSLPTADLASGDSKVGDTWPAGFYSGRTRIRRSIDGDMMEVSSNEYPFALLPRIIGAVQPREAPPGDITVRIAVEPAIQPQQRVALLFGNRVIPVPSPIKKTTSLSVMVAAVNLQAEETTRPIPVRIRVDGVESMPLAELKATDSARTPPTFDLNQIVTVKKP